MQADERKLVQSKRSYYSGLSFSLTRFVNKHKDEIKC